MDPQPRFIELNYHQHDELHATEDVIALHRPSNLFAPFLSDRADVVLVKHAAVSGHFTSEGTRYAFFRRNNRFFQLPRATHDFIVSQQPDFLLVQGLIFPVQVIALARRLKHCSILLQHQGELPFRRKKIFQRWADRYVHGYMFTSAGNAKEWFDAGIIRDEKKCYEIIPSSTTFTQKDKTASKIKTGMQAPVNFLWVGRLNANKDPLTVLAGFETYFTQYPDHQLHMVYSDAPMLGEIKTWLLQRPQLSDCIKLVGNLEHAHLEDWYSAADYFVSGSHREGGSYALTEAMACGCIPIVTTIPAAMKVTRDGTIRYSFRAGDRDDLCQLLLKLDHSAIPEKSANTALHFKNHFSPLAIANRIWQVCQAVRRK